MIALVLSGGGYRGALQVGALKAFFERGFQPDMLVGTSAGAINAAFPAPKPCLEQVERLISIWQQTCKENK